MDKSEVMAFVKRCLDELGINYDADDDSFGITFKDDDDLFPVNVLIFPNTNIISSFAAIADMEIPSNKRGAVLEYINNYNCNGIEDDGNVNAHVYIFTDCDTGKDFIRAHSCTLVLESMGIDEFETFTFSTLWALKAVMRGIFRLTM